MEKSLFLADRRHLRALFRYKEVRNTAVSNGNVVRAIAQIMGGQFNSKLPPGLTPALSTDTKPGADRKTVAIITLKG